MHIYKFRGGEKIRDNKRVRRKTFDSKTHEVAKAFVYRC